jgi:hypothetical protein
MFVYKLNKVKWDPFRFQFANLSVQAKNGPIVLLLFDYFCIKFFVSLRQSYFKRHEEGKSFSLQKKKIVKASNFWFRFQKYFFRVVLLHNFCFK